MTPVAKGATSQSRLVEMVDSTTGLPKTGVAYTAVTADYKRTRSAAVSVALSALGSATASYSSGGWYELGGGIYRLDVPNLAFATGADEVVVTVAATGCRTVSRGFDLLGYDPQDAQRLGLTALPSTGTLVVKPAVTLAAADVTGNVPADLQTIKTQAVTAAAGVAFPASLGTSTYAGADTAGTTTLLNRIGGAITISGGKVAATVATGDLSDISAVRAAKIDNLDATVSSRGTYSGGNITGNITGNLSGSVGSVTGAVGSVTGNVGGNVAGSVASVTAAVSTTANATEAAIKAVTDALSPRLPGSGTLSTFNGDLTALATASALSSVAAAVSGLVTTVGVAGAGLTGTAAAVRTNLAAELARVDVATCPRRARGVAGGPLGVGAAGSVTGTGGGGSGLPADTVAKLNRLAVSDPDGKVTTANPAVTVTVVQSAGPVAPIQS